MIFVTCGTHTMQFDRLIHAIDNLIAKGKIREKVVMQTGHSTYTPKHCEYFVFADFNKIGKLNKTADIIITHAGAGSIITALSYKKSVIAVPRLKMFGEHTDDHQLDLAKELDKEGKIIAVYKMSELEKAITKARKFEPKANGSQSLLKNLKDYLDKINVEPKQKAAK